MFPTVVFLEIDSLPTALPLETINKNAKVEVHALTQPHQVLERIQHATVVVVNKVVLTADILKQCEHVKMIAVSATGVSNVDTQYCAEAGIKIKNVSGYAKQTVAEHTFMMMLALKRNLVHYREDVNDGAWSKSDFFFYAKHEIVDLEHLTLGLIGSGDIGQRVAQLAKAFGMKVNFIARKNQPASDDKISFMEGISTSDILSIHCPLTVETTNLIAHNELEAMKKNAVLINTARGGIVHEGDLIQAIQQGIIKGVALDVASIEPMPDNHPLCAIRHLPNVIITPHCAWLSDNALTILITKLIDNINEFLSSYKIV